MNNSSTAPPKRQRFCFEFPPLDFKNMSKIILDLNDFSTKMEQIWNGNYELSRYEYPIISQIDPQRHIVHFYCTSRGEGCRFGIKLRYQITKLNEPCPTIKQANVKAMLGQFIDMKKVGEDNQIHFYKAISFIIMHNHATMPEKLSSIQSYKSLKPKQSIYNPQKHNFSKVFDHYRRLSQKQAKRYNPRTNNLDADIKNNIRLQERASNQQNNFMEQINEKVDLIKKQMNKQKTNEQRQKNQLFGEKVIFLCQYQNQFKQKNDKTEIQGIKNIEQNKEKKNIQINDKQSEDSFKGQPCVYFYSSLPMQKNLSNHPQIVNVIVLKSHSFQIQQQSQRLSRNTSYKYIFCSLINGKECLIFAVAFVCTIQHTSRVKKSIMEKFLNLPNTDKIETMILTHLDTQMLQIVEKIWNQHKKQGENKIKCIFRIPFCHEARNTCVNPNNLGSDVKLNKITKFYCQTRHFIGEFTQAVFQYFYNVSKRFEGHNSNKMVTFTTKNSVLKTKQPGEKYPFQDLYFILAFRVQQILIKMCLTLSPEMFSSYLLDLINQFCFSDYLIMLIHQKLIKHKDKIFLSQIPKQNRMFIGTNLFINLEGSIAKYFYVSNHNHNNLGSIINTVTNYNNSPTISFSNEKIFKILITQANKNNAQFTTFGKYWLNNTQTNYKESLYKFISQDTTNEKDIKRQKKRSDIQLYLLKNYQILQILLEKKYSIINRPLLSTKQVEQKLKKEKQSRSNIMKKLPYYNQSSLYMSQTARQHIFDKEIIKMLQFSIMDFSDRNIIATKGETLIDVCIITWNQNQIQTVRRGRDTDGLWVCTCGFMQFMRMPCRHILKAMMKYECNMISSVNQYWFKR